MRDTDKAAALLWLLREGLPKGSPTLVFASTRHHVEFLTLLLSLEGVGVTAVHGSMDQVCFSLGAGADKPCMLQTWSKGAQPLSTAKQRIRW